MSGPSYPRGVTSPTKVSSRHHSHHHHLPHSSHHHTSITAHVSSSLHRRARSRDERGSNNMMAQQQSAPRASLEVPRSEGVTPGNMTPNQSRRGSISMTPGAVSVGMVAGLPPLSNDESLRREKEKAEARTTGLKRSLAELTSSTTDTSRRLDEAYRVLYNTIPYLQQNILNLKELALASRSMNEGFIAESQAVLSEAQAQLDAFGSFDEQQTRVQALQDRVHNGREKISSLGARVDVVRQRVEKWERADREWQERTRRRLKIVWGVVLGIGLVLMVLYVGARAYAPEIDEVVRELREDASLIKMRPDGGLSPDKGENGAVPALNFSRDGRAEAGDEALRTLDEL